jgi:peptidoglycan/xylan/chitin deacetylase (PgdA/CDA1 family)
MLRKYRLFTVFIAVLITAATLSPTVFAEGETADTAAAATTETISKASYMCFIGTSAALSSYSGVRSFKAEGFNSQTVSAIKKACENDENSASEQEEISTSPDASKPMVALTFDDGPYSPVTDRILNKLEENGGHATFFVVGNRVSTYAASAKRAVSLGCQIGNHSYDHAHSLTKLTSVQIQKTTHDTDIAVAYYVGVSPALVRPVGGANNETVSAAVGKPMINWSIDTLDWKSKNAASVQSKVLDHVQDGDIVLMHDLYKSTADACDVIIPELVKRGYQLVTVSELAAAKGITLQNGTLYNSMR